MATPLKIISTTYTPESPLRKYAPWVLAGAGAAAVGSFFVARSVKAKRAANPKLEYNLEQQIEALKAIYPRLTQEFTDDVKTKYQFPAFALDRLKRMFDYTIIGGKYYRATLVLNTLQQLSAESGADIEKVWEGGLVLGWCIEILQAMFLVADDIMDGSATRRQQPCWYLVKDVQMDAVNDTLILESFMWFLINKYFRGSSQHVTILELFQSVSYQTQMGQMLDLLSQPQGLKDPKLLNEFNLDVYHRIVTFKTAIYTFYLPIAAGMILAGYDAPRQLALARDISIELGKKFQIEDDYLDCYGEPAKIGKDGTDIKDHKCSWLVVQALAKVTPEQRAVLDANYGRDEKQNESAIKSLYRELDLEKVYFAQEDASYARIAKLIEDNTNQLPKNVFFPILKKIHLRDK